MLTSCTWLMAWPPAGEGETFSQSYEQPSPEPRVVQTAQGTWLEQPPNDKPVVVKSNEEKAKELEIAMMKRDQALARIDQLEAQVQEMNKNMGVMMPAMTKLAQSQEQISQNLQQANTMNAQAGAVSMEQAAQPAHMNNAQIPASQMQPQAPQAAAQMTLAQKAEQHAMIPLDRSSINYSPQAKMHSSKHNSNQLTNADSPVMDGTAKVTDFRVGQHGDKARLVFETTDKVSYNYDLDNAEGLMIVTLSGARWDYASEQAFANHAFLSSYKAIEGKTGETSVIFQLKNPAKVEWVQSLEPVAGKGYRLIMDLTGQ